MGLDSNEKLLADYNDVFADIMNVFLFGGKRVIKEEQLENSKDRSQYKADGKTHEQERDVSKFYNGNEMRIAFLGIEHETHEQAYMPLRVISYDGSAYRAQLLNANNSTSIHKKQKPYPVITLVLYFGTKRWSYGKSLHEVLEIPKDLKKYVNDYKINLVEVAYLSEEQIDMLQSDFKIIADFFVQKRKNGNYIPSDYPIKHIDELLKIMEVTSGDERYQELLNELDEMQSKGRVNTMCEIYDQIEGRGIQKGIEQERVNTEKALKRAEAAEARAKAAEEELERLRKQLNQ
ncbi:MAG: Rpn family recombination-promoting nuclease/putative transposase [Lachnospiraceae bacterium]|nr:Rpn family recombination-promoting nuclease/putative transposase [Lachnospiraceae bacterium]